MNNNWTHIPRWALRIIVLAGLMYGVGLPLLIFGRTGDVRGLLIALVIGVGAAALLPIALLIRRALVYLEFYIFWYVATAGAILALVFGAVSLLFERGIGGIAILGVLLLVAGLWLFISRPSNPPPPENMTPRRPLHPLDEPPTAPAPRPRRPTPPPGPPDPDRINKELEARKRRINPS